MCLGRLLPVMLRRSVAALGRLGRARAPPSAPRCLCTAAQSRASSFASTPPEPSRIDLPFNSSSHNPEEFLVFRQPLYERFVNMLMMDGKKQTARKILWKTLTKVRDQGHNPHTVFEGALHNVLPMMEMRNAQRGQGLVPFPLAPRRAEGIAMKWLVGAARKRRANGNMEDRLSHELLQAYQNKGAAVGKREGVHKAALANQAGAHFRWRGAKTEPGAVDMDSRKLFRPGGRRAIRRLQRAMPRKFGR